MLKLRLIIASIILMGMSSIGLAAERVALVVGNSEYSHAPSLTNPKNDAADISAALARLGFEVTTVTDLGFDAMRRALRVFNSQAVNAEMAIIFYAGHGMEVNKQNYLVPSDAKLKTDRDVSFEAIPLGLVTEAVSGAKTLRLVILDACRDNPFATSMKMTTANRSLGRGLARLEPEPGTLVTYAAKEGTVALDGTDRNSPYTKALLRHLETPQLEINFLFREVRDQVLADTNGQQKPFTYGSLGSKRIYLNQAAGSTTASPAPVQPKLPTAPAQTAALELALWNEVKNSNDPNMLQLYVDRYPSGVFSGVAKQRISKFKAQANDKPKPEKTASLAPKSRSIRGPRGTIHLGDERIRGWPRTWGLCVSITIPQVSAGGLVRLRYQGFGVEDAFATLGNLRKRLPRMRNRSGRRRPNYWGRYKVIEFPMNRGFDGGEMRICSAKVRNPEKPGDRDDLQLRGISVEIRG